MAPFVECVLKQLSLIFLSLGLINEKLTYVYDINIYIYINSYLNKKNENGKDTVCFSLLF